MSIPDHSLRHWWNAHKACFPEDLQERAQSILMQHGAEWIAKLCTIEGEVELWGNQLDYEAASQLLLVLRHRGFDLAEVYCDRKVSDDEKLHRTFCEKERKERKEMEERYGQAG